VIIIIIVTKWGMKITNLKYAIQYQRGQPLKPFIDHITAKRIQATIDDKKIKQNLFKLVANSSYGQEYPYF